MKGKGVYDDAGHGVETQNLASLRIAEDVFRGMSNKLYCMV